MESSSISDEFQRLIQLKKARRERLKLELLANLAKPPSTPSVSDPSISKVDDTVISESNSTNEPSQTITMGLSGAVVRNQLFRLLVQYKNEKQRKATEAEEISKIKVIQLTTQKEIEESTRRMPVVRAKVRRMHRVLHALQQRLVASCIVLQYEMNREMELKMKMSSARYLRDSVMDNAFSFMFGNSKIDPQIPLGGVFSPYLYQDPDEEEAKATRLTQLALLEIPQHFKAGAQQRRASLREALYSGVAQIYQPPRTASIDYSSLEYLSSMASNKDEPFAEHKRRASDNDGNKEPMVGSIVAESSLAVKNIRTKSLKPSLSDRPTKYDSATPKKTGVFSWFKPQR